MLESLASELGNTCSWSHPVGGLFIWVRVPDDVDVDRLIEIGEANDVGFAHGSNFHIHKNAGP